MIVSIASGKGGTGKTTIAVNLALALENVQILDCDVEEPNCHIFIKPEIKETEEVNIFIPQIDRNLCNSCGRCAEFCRYNALAVVNDTVMTFPQICHSCGGCVIVCPKKAIKESPKSIGKIVHGKKGDLSLSYGVLNIGEAMASPIIDKLRSYANPKKNVIVDAPPGTSCAVIQSVRSTDYCILVTEPTPFGLNDLKLASKMLDTLSVPYGVIINREGMGDEQVEEYCKTKNIPILLRIPYDIQIAKLYSQGIPFSEQLVEYKKTLKEMFEKIQKECK